MSDQWHIASLLVQAKPELREKIGHQLKTIENLEVSTFTESGKWILIIEAPHESVLMQHIEFINNIQGVLSTNLVYHHCESFASMQEEVRL